MFAPSVPRSYAATSKRWVISQATVASSAIIHSYYTLLHLRTYFSSLFLLYIITVSFFCVYLILAGFSYNWSNEIVGENFPQTCFVVFVVSRNE